uniref:Sodium/calcium exchanger membrane region domain-containing protein n=1 Tax=Paramoeba aestuarina TaxID=180227 RepID=A0A7S4NBM3_9EUKA|mmetsp:Transcript_14147/g.22023  ORF Transcript_14147/g.22023 Transcript_14147/m.22023 type:complete len:757 (+) Transcript_14147:64-2334(+)
MVSDALSPSEDEQVPDLSKLKKGRNSTRRAAKLGILALALGCFVLINVALDHYRGRPDIHDGGKGLWTRSDLTPSSLSSSYSDALSQAISSSRPASSSFFINSTSPPPTSYSFPLFLPLESFFSSLSSSSSFRSLSSSLSSRDQGGLGDGGKKCTFVITKDDGSEGQECESTTDVCELYELGCEEQGGLINYIGFYCNFPIGWVCVVVFLVPWLVCIFFLLGMTAEDYFCPVLNIISDRLSLSPEVAGITILALGNGSPDVFSTIVAIQSPPDGFKIAIGELIGAGCFVTMTVVGVVAVVATCNLKRVSFIRDVCFYMGGVCVVALMISRQEIPIYESLLLLVGYGVYVGVSIWMNYMQKKKKNTLLGGREDQLLSEKGEISDIDDDDLDDIDFSGVEEESRKIYLAKVGIVVQDEEDDSYHVIQPRMSPRLSPRHPQRRGSRSEYEILAHQGGGTSLLDDDEHSINKDEEGCVELTFWEKYQPVMQERLEQFAEECCWDEKSWKEKFLYVLFSPFTFLFNATIPVPDEENWSRRWAYICPIFIPLVLSVAFGFLTNLLGGVFPLMLIVEAAALPVAALIYYFTNDNEPPKYKYIFVAVSFFMSILWIYLIANELVSLLTALGAIIGIPPDIMGLTVLAWGNSVGDMVSNVIVAKQGYPSMALAATYGGPLFNLFLGLGLAITFWTALNYPSPYCVNFTSSVIIAMVFLVISLAVTLSVVAYNKFLIPKKFSAFLISWYCLYMLFAVLNKVGVLQF